MTSQANSVSGSYDDSSGESEALEQYMCEITTIPKLSVEEEAELAPRIRAGDQNALNRMVEANLRFVVVIALEYQNRGLPLLDLINEGNVGLIMAAQRFDETRGCKFISYAVWWIRQAIRQAFADHVRFIRLPRLQVEALNRLEEAIRTREQAASHAVSVQEVTTAENEQGDPFPRHLHWLMTAAARPYSLDEPVDEEEAGWVAQVPDNQQPTPDEVVMDHMLKETVHHAVDTLPEREANILRQYFGMFDDKPKTLDEIGQQLGMSRERVRQLKERGLQRLRHASRSLRLHACL